MAMYSTMGGVQPQASFKHAQSLIERIHKGGGHTRYGLQYINIIITCSCLFLFSTKSVNWGGLYFISMSI